MLSFDASRQRSWLRLAVVPALLLALFAAGCGAGSKADGGQEPGKPASFAVAHGESIEDCLIEVGVQFAVLPHDIAFFEDAQRAGDVSEGGSAYDNVDKVDVRLLLSKRGGAKKWMLWYTQEPSSRSPEYVLRHQEAARAASSRPVFVAFALKPKFSFRKEIRRCVRFPLSPS